MTRRKSTIAASRKTQSAPTIEQLQESLQDRVSDLCDELDRTLSVLGAMGAGEQPPPYVKPKPMPKKRVPARPHPKRTYLAAMKERAR